MPKIILGHQCKIYRNTGTSQNPTWNEIPNVRDVSITLEATEAEVTTRASGGWKQYVAGLFDLSVEFESVWDKEDDDLTALRQAYFDRTAIEFAIVDGKLPPDAGQNTQGIKGTFVITRFAPEQPLDEAATVSITLRPTLATNNPSWITQGT